MLLYLLQPIRQQLFAGDLDAHGQRVDKQPDHGLNASELRRTAGHGSSVDDITLATVPAE